MNNIEETFRINLKKYLKEQRKTQKDLAEYLEVSPAIVSYYIKGINTPRMDKIDKISEFFGIERSDLIGHNLDLNNPNKTDNQNDNIDISNMVNDLMENLNSTQTLMYKGEPMDEVTKELVRASIEQAARIALARHKESKIDN
ncbi:helix-turn-helix domain-containing protein [Gemella sanguinis]|jgi:XRE family transcriptional regulator|uniref:helix-turn-helix domain-containing protein n=1 Tax=Gemella sanguinis TaxID=84135 RepID=UPI0008076B96|nr:helix-turn-helix transcriptional regulator [Gemella sanguinis]